MAIQQVLSVYLNLKGDGSSTTFTFALQNLYQFANGIAVPFGGAGVVPTSVVSNNPPFPVTSTSIDANGNITLTLTSALGSGVVATFQLDLTFNSGTSTSASPTQTTNVTVVGSSAVTVSGTVAQNLTQVGGSTVALGSAVSASSIPVVIASNQGVFPVNIQSSGTALTNTGGSLNVNITGGSSGNGAASATGSAVPAQAGYTGVNIAGNLVGVTGFSLTNSKAAAMAIVDGTGNQITSFGGGSQFAMASAQSSSALGTIALGYDGTNVRGLSTNSSGQLNVIFPSAQAVTLTSTTVTGTVAVTQSGSWTVTSVGSSASGATATGNPVQIGGVFNTTQPTVTTGQGVSLQATARGGLIVSTGVDAFTVTLASTTITGSVTVAQATAASLNATVVGTGTFAVQATQSGTWTVQPGNTANTTAWLVTGTGGTFPVTQATAANLNATVVGNLTHNNAAPAANNVGALVGVASSAAPTYTTGDQVLLSTDLAGNLRTISTAGALSDLVGTAGTLNAANTTATINAAGYSHVGMFLAAGTLVGTIVAECSLDGGTTWVGTFFNDPTTNATQASIVFGSSNTATTKSLVGVAGASNYRVRVSAFTSGTASCTLRANEIGDPSSLQGGLVASTTQPPCTVQDGAWVTTAAPTYSTTTLNPLSLTTAGGVRSDMSSVNATALGTPTAFGTSPGAVNALQVNSSVFIGTTVAVAAAAGIQKVGISGNAGATFDAVITAGTAAANMIQVGGVFNSTVPALTTGQAVVLQVDPTGSQFVSAEGRKTTYRAATAATATAGTGVVLQITGSATKTVKITRIHVTAFAATAAQTTFKLQRTSAAATAGTSAALTAGKLDNNDAAATAVVTHWTATGGTTGTTVGGALISDSVWMQPSTFAAPTSTGHDREWNAGQFPGGKEIVLRGTSDLMTLTSSGTLAASQVWVEWTEE